MTQSEYNEKIKALEDMEAKLQQPIVIKTVTDLIRLLHRYREYLEQFKVLGMAIAQKHYPNYCKQVTLDDIGVSLYLNFSNNKQQLVFENECWLNTFVTEDLEYSFTILKELQALYFCPDFLAIKSSFYTPITITDNIVKQIPSCWAAYDFVYINDVIAELTEVRSSKLEKLIVEL